MTIYKLISHNDLPSLYSSKLSLIAKIISWIRLNSLFHLSMYNSTSHLKSNIAFHDILT